MPKTDVGKTNVQAAIKAHIKKEKKNHTVKWQEVSTNVCACGVLCVFLPPIDERAVAPAAHWQEKGVKMLWASDNCMCMSLEMWKSFMFLYTTYLPA